MPDHSPSTITTSAASWLGASLGWQIALMGVLPIGFALSISLHSPMALYLTLAISAIVAGSGGFWIRRHRYRFNLQQQSIDRTTLWFFRPTQVQRINTDQVRSFDLIDTKRGPQLKMSLNAGSAWVVKTGSRDKLEQLRETLGGIIVVAEYTIETPGSEVLRRPGSSQYLSARRPEEGETLDSSQSAETEASTSSEYVQPRRFGELSRMDCLIPESTPAPVQPSITAAFEIADPPAVSVEEKFADDRSTSLLDPAHIALPQLATVAAALAIADAPIGAMESVTAGAAVLSAMSSSEQVEPAQPAELAVEVFEPPVIAASVEMPGNTSAEVPAKITEVSVLETVGQEIPAESAVAEAPVDEPLISEPPHVAVTPPIEPPATTVFPQSPLPSSNMQKLKVGIIGGSGLAKVLGGQTGQRHEIHTPFGAPSDAIIETEWAGVPVFLLARHGPGHLLNPAQVPYQANIFALKQLGCTHIIASGAVGSLREEMKPRDLALPDQIIDKTSKRPATFFDNTAVHVEFSEPFCPVLRQTLIEAAAPGADLTEVKYSTHDRGCYVAMEGPAFSTRAESLMHRLWGGDLIGMTAMPEAKLAREAEISYALVALVTDYDCWKQKPPTASGLVAQKSVEPVDPFVLLQEIIANLESASSNAMGLIRKAIELIASRQEQLMAAPSRNALKLAIWSDRAKISEDEKARLKVLWGRHFEEAAATQ